MVKGDKRGTGGKGEKEEQTTAIETDLESSAMIPEGENKKSMATHSTNQKRVVETRKPDEHFIITRSEEFNKSNESMISEMETEEQVPPTS